MFYMCQIFIDSKKKQKLNIYFLKFVCFLDYYYGIIIVDSEKVDISLNHFFVHYLAYFDMSILLSFIYLLCMMYSVLVSIILE